MSAPVPKLPDEIVEAIREHRGREHGESYVIAMLQRVQNHFGYLPKSCMDEVAQQMQVPTARIAGIATFYHFFSLTPKGRTRLTVCMGTACFVRGADKVLERLKELLGIRDGETTPDGRFSIENARCLGACALAPVLLVNERVYGNVKPADLERILKEHGWKAPGKPSRA